MQRTIILAIAILIATFENMLRSTTLSLNYILYRYIVTGQYDYAPVNYTKLFIPALLAGSIGIIFMFFYFTKTIKIDFIRTLSTMIVIMTFFYIE